MDAFRVEKAPGPPLYPFVFCQVGGEKREIRRDRSVGKNTKTSPLPHLHKPREMLRVINDSLDLHPASLLGILFGLAPFATNIFQEKKEFLFFYHSTAYYILFSVSHCINDRCGHGRMASSWRSGEKQNGEKTLIKCNQTYPILFKRKDISFTVR